MVLEVVQVVLAGHITMMAHASMRTEIEETETMIVEIETAVETVTEKGKGVIEQIERNEREGDPGHLHLPEEAHAVQKEGLSDLHLAT